MSPFAFVTIATASALVVVLDVLTLPHRRLYNNIVPPSQLPQKANYYLFKVRGVPDAPSNGR